jgi:group I intron endonuclease
MYGIIFKTTCTINGKIYVGQTTRILSENYLGSGIVLQKAIKKYGKEKFIRTILSIAKSLDELNQLEQFWIKKLRSQNQEIGYNVANGGNSVGKHANSTKLKISQAALNRCNEEEYRKELSKRIKLEWNDNRKKELSEDMKYRYKSKNYKKFRNSRIGKSHSKEAKHKISLSSKNRICSNTTRQKLSESVSWTKNKLKVYDIICIETKNKFKTIKEASIWLKNYSNTKYSLGWISANIKKLLRQDDMEKLVLNTSWTFIVKENNICYLH